MTDFSTKFFWIIFSPHTTSEVFAPFPCYLVEFLKQLTVMTYFLLSAFFFYTRKTTLQDRPRFVRCHFSILKMDRSNLVLF